ncbi:hypothetical protein [Actinomadura rudentiformis]|uniref:hypothetical protein n=1 Tax=Actinomadura rudentiformis TaxID=359158 RepID=UPI001CEF9880|nr:hypothetical protein [Actinomadura rudentiformis]
MPAQKDGGALRGGAPRVSWFSSESDPRTVSARSVAADLLREGRAAHVVWNPCSGEIIQSVPITRAAPLLGDVGREGRVNVQIMVVGHARDPFTNTLLTGLDPIMRWLDSWGVTRRWPAGPPLPSPQSYHSSRSRRDWSRGGHFGASQVPGANRPDPGGIDIRRVTGPDTPVATIPRPRPALNQENARPPTRLPRPAELVRVVTDPAHTPDPPRPVDPTRAPDPTRSPDPARPAEPARR